MSQTLYTRFFKLPTFTAFRLGSAFGGVTTTQILIKIGPSSAQVGDGSVLTGIDSHQSVVHYPLKFNFSNGGGGGGGGGSAPTVFATITISATTASIVLSNLASTWGMYDTSGSNPTLIASAPFTSTPFNLTNVSGDYALALSQSDVDGWWNGSGGNTVGSIFTFDNNAGSPGITVRYRPAGALFASSAVNIMDQYYPALLSSMVLSSTDLVFLGPLTSLLVPL